MSRLYPPHIEGKIQAQSGEVLQIPFRSNRAVSNADYDSMKIEIKSVSTGLTITQLSSSEIVDNIAYFPLIGNLTKGQYYKAQLAFVDKSGVIGYYSSIGVFKYTEEILPGAGETNCIYIEDMNGIHKHQYLGIYNHEGDRAEKAYTYCFNIYDKYSNAIVLTSGKQIHNTNTDTSPDESFDTWYINQPLIEGKTYEIEYIVETVNNHTCSTDRYPIVMRAPGEDDKLNSLHMGLQIDKDFDNGCIHLLFKEINNIRMLSSGEFVISRSSSKDRFATWTDIFRFGTTSTAAMPSKIFTDYTVEQGVAYIYALQQYGQNTISDRVWFIHNNGGVWEDVVVADFEDMFLYDGERQFKIRYNPKVSSFKATVLETKTDTIGGQYPFIFRNGDIRYQELGLSGLVSQMSDTNELFMRKETLGYDMDLAECVRTNTPDGRFSQQDQLNYQPHTSTNLTTENFLAERTFKNFANSWFTNGKPKLLRTPAEGNFIVRLMNTSLSPMDGLSRMLHTFTSTAYEIAECNMENLINHNIIKDCFDTIKDRVVYSTSIPENKTINYVELLENKEYTISYRGGQTEEKVRGKGVLNILDRDILNIDGGSVVIGYVDEYPESISYSLFTREPSSETFGVYTGMSQDFIPIAERMIAQGSGFSRADIIEWTTLRFEDRLSNEVASWNGKTYEIITGYDKTGKPQTKPLDTDYVYQIAGSSNWVDGKTLKTLSYLEHFIKIKPSEMSQETIYLDIDGTPFTISNMNIDYLYVGNCVRITGGSCTCKLL